MINKTDCLPSIDIIIVNYNGITYLSSCLESLFQSQYPKFSVIVVDNNSTDGSVSWIKANYPNVVLIENKKNEGFGRANQKGIRFGSSPFFALLNNDTKVDPKWLLPLVEVMQKEPLCAAACSKLLFMNNPELINATGGGMNFVGYGYDHNIFSIDPDSDLLVALSPIDHKPQDVFFPTAAAALFRRSCFDDIGGFDSSFFMYHEDVDLGWRFNLKGYSVKYVPQSVVFHAFGGTSLKLKSMNFRNRLGLRHALRSLLKNYEINSLKKVLPIFFQLGVNNFRAGIPTGFFRAILWNLFMMPDTIIRRARVQQKRKKSDNELLSLIWQDVYLPVQFPDYQIQTIDSFIKNYQNTPDNKDFNLNSPLELINSHTSNLGYGWHPLEIYFGDGETLYRWTRQRAQLFFWHNGGSSILRLKVLGLAKLLKNRRRFSVQLKMADSSTFKKVFLIESDGWEYFDIEFSGDKGVVEVLISVSDMWSPHNKFKNRDYRQLGIGIASATVSPD
ncbi:MAG: glycosyltransferase family 2 protein [Desulfamplus sp.]|nr:glycosyltransferase family 2 protein [Desulfamplus sp.]